VSRHSSGYTGREELDKSRAYDCNLCPHVSTELDAARAHYAVYVAGPDMLTALKEIENAKYSSGARTIARCAVAKAEPKGA